MLKEMIEKEEALNQIGFVFGLAAMNKVDQYEPDFIKIVVQYGKAGLDIEKSIELSRKFGERGLNFIRNFL
jgi:uncharacterized protein (DUF4213/DUF364 family)